jgi:hypothetical protein
MDDLPFPTKLRQLSRIYNGDLYFPIIIRIFLPVVKKTPTEADSHTPLPSFFARGRPRN